MSSLMLYCINESKIIDESKIASPGPDGEAADNFDVTGRFTHPGAANRPHQKSESEYGDPEALSEGLRVHAAAERSVEVLNGYKKAFSGLSDEEVAILDGVILEPAARR